MKILVVDDDSVILELIQLFLASIEFEDVHLATSGQDALDMSLDLETPFDCILLDINMPEMTGIELIGRFRQIPEYKDIPIIMLTALGDRRHVAQAFVAGAWDYIIKPFDPFDLETRVHGARLRLADQRRMQQRMQKQTNTAEQDFEAMFQRHAALSRRSEGIEPSETGVISGDRFENCLERLALNSPNAISLAVIELENLAAIARKLGPKLADEYLIVLADHLTDALGTGKAILAYQGHGVFLVLSFAGPDSNPNVVSAALLRAMSLTDAAFLADISTKAQVRIGEVSYRDLPKGAEPVEMLLAAAQSMAPPDANPWSRQPLH